MTNILTAKIQNAKLTKTQEKIARYFLRNMEHIGSLSSMEVAKEIGVSDASIIRFSRSIGYEGFADLKADIYKALVENAYSGLSLTQRMAKSAMQYGDADLDARFLDMMQRNLTNSFRINDTADFQKVAQMLIQSRKRFVIGLRGCRGVASQFSRLMSFMLPNVVHLQDSECVSINALQDAAEEDVVLMFVFSRFYKIDEHYLKMAQKRGAKICLITDEMVGPLTGFADVILHAETENMSFF